MKTETAAAPALTASGERTDQRGHQEAAAVHGGKVGRMMAKVNVRTPVGAVHSPLPPEPAVWPALSTRARRPRQNSWETTTRATTKRTVDRDGLPASGAPA